MLPSSLSKTSVMHDCFPCRIPISMSAFFSCGLFFQSVIMLVMPPIMTTFAFANSLVVAKERGSAGLNRPLFFHQRFFACGQVPFCVCNKFSPHHGTRT